MRVRSIRDLASVVRGRRKDLGLSQAELAQRVGVSRKWIYEFEGGKPKAEMVLLLQVLAELGLGVDVEVDSGETTGIVDLDRIIEEHR